jgi:hypothetical protein
MMRLSKASLLVCLALVLCLSALGQKTQLMRVTAIEYHKEDAHTPYRVEGQTTQPVFYYQLDCKKGAVDLHVGNSYQVAEGTDENGLKSLTIFYGDTDKPEPTVIGVVCVIESVRAKQ